jgi:hypothetical protein
MVQPNGSLQGTKAWLVAGMLALVDTDGRQHVDGISGRKRRNTFSSPAPSLGSGSDFPQSSGNRGRGVDLT